MGTLNRSYQTHPKCQHQLVGNFHVYLYGKNKLHHYFFCLDIAKILPTDFGYFGHVCPLPSKRIMPTCGNFDINLYAKNEFDA